MNELTETEKAYLAGFVDGEGCITITKYTQKKTGRPVYCLLVIVSQKDIRPLSHWKSITGIGSVHKHKKTGNHSWNITSNDARDFLISIKRYLFIKPEQAEIAIEFCGTLSRHCDPSESTMDKRERLYKAIALLHQRESVRAQNK